MDGHDALAKRFEATRIHLRAVAYRMLGSRSEAEDAVQEAWLRLSRADTTGIDNLGGWLTTVVSRVCLDMLRSRKSRREEPLDPHCRSRSWARSGGLTPSRKWHWPTRSGLRSSLCSKPFLPPSGSPSCCTTCSTCHSTTLLRSSRARPPRQGSSQAAPGAACRARRRRPRPSECASEK